MNSEDDPTCSRSSCDINPCLKKTVSRNRNENIETSPKKNGKSFLKNTQKSCLKKEGSRMKKKEQSICPFEKEIQCSQDDPSALKNQILSKYLGYKKKYAKDAASSCMRERMLLKSKKKAKVGGPLVLDSIKTTYDKRDKSGTEEMPHGSKKQNVYANAETVSNANPKEERPSKKKPSEEENNARKKQKGRSVSKQNENSSKTEMDSPTAEGKEVSLETEMDKLATGKEDKSEEEISKEYKEIIDAINKQNEIVKELKVKIMNFQAYPQNCCSKKEGQKMKCVYKKEKKILDDLVLCAVKFQDDNPNIELEKEIAIEPTISDYCMISAKMVALRYAYFKL